MGCCFSDSTQEERAPILQTYHYEEDDDDIDKYPPPPPPLPATSARRFRPPPNCPAVARTGIDVIIMKPVGIEEIDKKLEDHAELYNSQVRRWYDLDRFMEQLKVMFYDEDDVNTIPEVFAHIKKLIDEDPDTHGPVTVQRQYQYCMEIVFDDKKSKFNAVAAMTAFNHANRLIKEMIDKDGPLRTSIELVIKDEASLRREVLVASMDGHGPDALKATMDNVTQLRRAVNMTESIRQEALNNFEQLKDGVAPLTGTAHV